MIQSSTPVTRTIFIRTYVLNDTAMNARIKNGIIIPRMKGRFDSAALAAKSTGLSVGLKAVPPVASAVARPMVDDIDGDALWVCSGRLWIDADSLICR
ncbi:hypothetical protein ONS95_004441 [Cadophora gregata]|uniref:uncharacterized protein n=1 Tax=Cadophora gregata TaxID=51156 RepID=UPI0026DBE4B6|nr:uncharacterized protein ONS95_004441 [Cadophora gregata]KAK0105161.1 hypothetical protein ONS96_004562 [Cadophora gregata f. sp. sojae]KAK0105928.1 hypothetical protein ONS95_004441 [Cadophora gregata]